MSSSPLLTVEYLSASDALTAFYNLLENKIGISKFNQTVPLIISGVAIGVCLVNRNFPKCIGHIIGAIFISIPMIVITFSGNVCNQFTTSFLWYTISYLVLCMQASKRLDSNTLIGIILSLIILVFIDGVSYFGGFCKTLGSKTYIGMLLLGLIGGIGGFYVTKSIGGDAALYDFGGCSCDDCEDQKCSVGSKMRTVIAQQIGGR